MKIQENDLIRNQNNFDFLRLLAAVFVLIGHAPKILYGASLSWDPFLIVFNVPVHSIGVIIFFTISGFLVMRSWELKKNSIDFLIARVLRIFPALIVLILLSVFVLGLSITKANTSTYLSHDYTHKYLQNMLVFRTYYHLPEVFKSNPGGDSINGSLWTLSYEFACYLFLMVMGLLFIFKNKWIALGIFGGCVLCHLFLREELDKIVIPILGIDFNHFYELFLFFFSGMLIYLFRNLIPFNLIGLSIAIILIFLAKFIPEFTFLYLLIIPYLVFYFVFSKNLPLNKTGKFGDFSYGIYLYAFPVQQLLVYLFPLTFNVPIFIFLSIICTFPFALMSWNLIEKPCLGMRKKLATVLRF